jgi:hypothetical protein
MRIAGILVCGMAAACAATTAAPPRAQAPVAPLPGHPTGDVVLFVRDATQRPTTLATTLCQKLVAAGVPCRALPAASQAATPWAVDAPIAHSSGAAFAVRVTVVQRQDVKDPLHQEDWESRDASGLIGRRVTVDVGQTTNAEDLRLDVMASLRRATDGSLINRWIDSGGSLDVTGAPNDENRRWEAIYDAMAERLSRQVLAALPWTRAR